MLRKKQWFEKYNIAIIIFIVTILFQIIFNLATYKELYSTSIDGDLYISISENFIKNFHFIQTSRPHELNMVVPPGLPFILSILLLIGNSISFVIFFQYLLFGFSCVLLYKSTVNFLPCDKKSWKTIAGIIVVILYNLSTPVLYDAASPRYILTEIYTQSIYILILYLFTNSKYNIKRKLEISLPILLVGSLIRPLFFPPLFFNMLIYVIIVLKNKESLKYIIRFSVIMAAIFAINIGINYRETKDFVILENYTGIPLYQANNKKTLTEPYYASRMEEFSDNYFMKIYQDDKLTTTEKSNLLSSKAKKWIFSNFGTFVKNTFIKFYNLFIVPYNYDFIFFVLGSIILFFVTKKIELLLLFCYFGMTMGVTSVGLNIYRYSIFANIIYIFMKVNLIGYLMSLIISKMKKRI